MNRNTYENNPINKIIPIFLWIIASLFGSKIILQIFLKTFTINNQLTLFSFHILLKPLKIKAAFLLNTFSELIFFLLLLIGNLIFFKVKTKFFSKKLISAILIILPTIIFLSGNLILAVKNLDKKNESLNQILIIILFVLVVGLTEEYGFRGLLLGKLLQAKNKNKFYLLISVILQGLAFGLTHSINIFHQSFSETITQLIYASAIGIIFGLVYIKTAFLTVTIIFHALIDGLAFIASPQSIVKANNTEIPLQTTYFMLGIFLSIIIYAIIIIFFSRSKNLNKLWR